ncbi:MAG: CDP-alcohol phosphatidyltransferase family protein [Chloroflexi bacterium]|nr:CDP-alcohol phosphatidyltransferase family protein [Chloroflexota bacterium]
MVRPLAARGVSPSALTVAGFLAMAACGALLGLGHLALGGFLVIPASAFDALDGPLARTTGRASRFGAFLDSTLDRWAEIALYLGLLYHFAQRGEVLLILLTYLSLSGSTMVSYARARAEGLGIECRVGMFTRLERIVILVAGLVLEPLSFSWGSMILRPLPLALAILALFSNLTAVQRMLYVRERARQR